MIGLCHYCLTSGIEIFVNRGVIRCQSCIGKMKAAIAAKAAKILQFEDLPEISKDQREKEQFVRTQKAMDKAFEDREQRNV